jgi:hypothetical protein
VKGPRPAKAGFAWSFRASRKIWGTGIHQILPETRILPDITAMTANTGPTSHVHLSGADALLTRSIICSLIVVDQGFVVD